MSRKNNYVVGGILILFGILIILKNLNLLNIYFNIFDIGFLISNFWAALFIIVPGLIFHIAYFKSKDRKEGLLVPGGILVTWGLACQISFTFHLWNVLWPAFILGVAVGLFELYLFGNRNKGILIPVGILGGVSLIFFSSFSTRWLFQLNISKYFLPGILVILGAWIIFKKHPDTKDT